MRFIIPALVVSTLLFAPQALAMDGINLDTGDAISVEDGTVFNEGEIILVFDTEGNALEVEVQKIAETETSWNLDVQDLEEGDKVSLEFEK